MNNKEKAIELAYGKMFKSLSELQQKEVLENDGWIYGLPIGVFKDYKIDYDIKNGIDFNYFRPKSLQGIETNNGWIKIESEKDLPSEKELFRFIPCGKFENEFVGWIDKEKQEVLFIDFKYYEISKDGNIYLSKTNAWLTSQITHYQPVEKKPKPIH